MAKGWNAGFMEMKSVLFWNRRGFDVEWL